MQLLFTQRDQTESGIFQVLSPQNSPSKELELDLLRMSEGEVVERIEDGKESVLVLLGGSCSIVIEDSHRWVNIGERDDVFSGRATAVYIPRNTKYRVIGEKGLLEAALVRAPTETRGTAFVVWPKDIKVVTRGRNNWRREVHNILDSTHSAGKLLVGETFNEPGGWSSYPPHKHDVHNPPHEAQLEELYHFRIQPVNGFGIQRIYSKPHELDETFTVGHGDTVFIPFGYHTVVGAAECRLYYLWVLAGNGRILQWQQDPVYNWIM